MRIRNNRLILPYNSGFFSCCSLACHDIIQFLKMEKKVPIVDFSRAFGWYKDHANEDVYNKCFKPDINESINVDDYSSAVYNQRSLFDYRHEPLNLTTSIVRRWFAPSDEVRGITDTFCNKYNIVPERTLAICFRGTDKHQDVMETPYNIFTSRVRGLIKTNNINRVLIQTDQRQFINFFKRRFPEIDSFFIEENPTTTTRKHLYKYHDSTITHNKCLYAQRFLATTILISRCNTVINHTGNVARWIVKYRGSTDNTLQYKANKLVNDEPYVYGLF